MTRRVLLLLIAAGAVSAAGPRFKDLLDPQHKDYPLLPYSWSEWDKLDKASRFNAKGADPNEWMDPPPKTEEEIAEEEKKEAELTEEQKEKRRQRREANKRARRSTTFPGFKFELRLRKKQAAFETIIQPASASKLEGLVKRLKLLDRSLDKYQKVVDEAEAEYVKYKDQLDKIIINKQENYKKRYGKYPESVNVPASLQATVRRNSRRLQRLLSIRQSELQFHDWLVERLIHYIGELNPDERKKPIAALAKGITDRDWRYRIRCARLLGSLADEASVAAFSSAMEKETDPLVLAELVRIRVKRGGEGLLELLARRLEDDKWPVRAAAVRALGRIRKKESVQLLVARMQKEEGRLLDDIADALRKLTGEDFEAKPDPWRIWWEKNKQHWTPPKEVKLGDTLMAKKGGKVVYFYGIRSSSKHVVFCVDISGSMNFPLDGQGGKKPARIIRAKRELTQALSALSDDAMFNIVVYSVAVRVWKKRMQQATLKNKQAARKFVERLEPSGGTNIFDALMTSLEVAAKAGKKKRKGAGPEADTIFFLTDGQPTVGRITDPKQIIEEITNRNRMLGIKIHTVGVSKEQNAGFLLNLAKRNGGRYVAHK